jgi:hypothetical protein
MCLITQLFSLFLSVSFYFFFTWGVGQSRNSGMLNGSWCGLLENGYTNNLKWNLDRAFSWPWLSYTFKISRWRLRAPSLSIKPETQIGGKRNTYNVRYKQRGIRKRAHTWRFKELCLRMSGIWNRTERKENNISGQRKVIKALDACIGSWDRFCIFNGRSRCDMTWWCVMLMPESGGVVGSPPFFFLFLLM